MTKHKLIVNGFRGLVTTALVSLLVACGGSGGGSDDEASGGSVPIAARGVITQLGSIWVLGVEYETPNGGSYSDDDNVSSVANYKVGQVVRIRGRRNDDGVSGTADEVEYEAEIEGIASAGAITGVAIVITPTTNTAGATLIGGALSDGNRYEVSGIWLDDSTLEATYIKDDDDGDGEDEIKGFVENAIAATSFELRSITFNFTGAPAVANGDFVEVHFNPATCSAPPNVTCDADRVELEDDFNDQNEGLEVEVEGAVNLDAADLANCPANADFLIDMTCIDWDSVPADGWMDGLNGPEDMAAGLRVEAEGHMVNGVLIAEKIKGRGNRVRISSIAGSVSTGPDTFRLIEGNIDVITIDGMTEYEDGLTINNIDAQVVEVRGVRTGLTEMLAVRIKETGLSGGGTRHELRAQIDVGGADIGTSTVTVMGVVSMALSGTELEVNDAAFFGSIASFLGLIDDDGIVNSNNPPNDVIDVDFDIATGNGSAGNPYDAHEIEIEEEDD